jgi:hypothetical protein
MTKRISGAGGVLISSLLIVSALAACSRSTESSSAPPAADAGQASSSNATTAAQGSQSRSRSASLTWPQGTDAFTLNICTSIGEHTIQGGGNSDGGKWNLVLDGNLLKPGDTGRLTVSQKSDMSVVYDAKLTDLTVAPDGSFTGSGEDASKARFTITGTCDVTW